MSFAEPIKTNFTAGELSPRLMGRVDLTKYFNGAEKIENFFCLVAGGVTRRPGTCFVLQSAHTGKSRLMGFEFNVEQAYILEAYEQGFRVFMDGAPVYAWPCNKQVTNGAFETDLAGWTVSGVTWDAGKRAKFNAAGNYIEQKITFDPGQDPVSMLFDVGGAAGDYITLTIGTTSGGTQIVTAADFKKGSHVRSFDPNGATDVFIRFAYGDGACYLDNVLFLNDEPIRFRSPYAEAHLFELQSAQSADVMYLAHRSYPPYRLERFSHDDWSIREVEFVDGPYGPKNLDTTWKLAPSALTGTGVTITASGTGNKPFKASMVGKHVALKHPRTQAQKDDEVNPWGFGVITGYTSPTQVTITVIRDFLLLDATDEWMLGAWAGDDGYPAAVTFYEERLWFGGSPKYPQTAWGSKSGDWENFGMGADPTDGITYTVSTDQVNSVQWLSPGKTLAMGTAGGECVVRAADINEAITPDNIVIKRETSYGSAGFQPLRIDQVILFGQRARRKLREFVYSFEVDGFVSADLGILSEHILRNGFQTMAYQQEPNSMVWIPTEDGVLAALTYQRAQEVVGWSRQLLGGKFGTDEFGHVESVACIPVADHNQLWMTVKRTVNGQTVRHIEYLMPEFWANSDTDKSEAFFLDSHLVYDGAPTTVLSGLNHLIGETVDILADGAVQASKVVDNGGSITLDSAASHVVVGLPYTSKMRTVRFEPGNPLGTSQGKNTRLTYLTLRFFQTLGGYAGYDDEAMDELVFRDSDDLMDESPPLYTGDVRISVDHGYTTSIQSQVEQRQPLPMTILAVMPEYEVF